MDVVETQQKELDKKLPVSAIDPDAIEHLTNEQVQVMLKTREEWSMERSRLTSKALQTMGQVPYELAWGNDGGVAKFICK